MMYKPNIGDVVQFNERHKWCGAFGYVSEVKQCGDDIRVMIGATIPDNQTHCSTAYVYSMLNDNDFDIVGKAALLPREESDEDEEQN